VPFGIVKAVLLMRVNLDPNCIFRVYNFHDQRQVCYSISKYGVRATLKALQKIVLEAAFKIEKNYKDVQTCCDTAMYYSNRVESEKILERWAEYYYKKRWAFLSSYLDSITEFVVLIGLLVWLYYRFQQAISL
jgi:hypothetical protein